MAHIQVVKVDTSIHRWLSMMCDLDNENEEYRKIFFKEFNGELEKTLNT